MRPWLNHAYRAWLWWGKGNASCVEPSPSAALMDCVDILQSESNSLERKQMDDDRRDAEGARKKPAKKQKAHRGY